MSQPDEAVVRSWTEKCVGGRVVACERQPRWRPAWFLEVDRNGERLSRLPGHLAYWFAWSSYLVGAELGE